MSQFILTRQRKSLIAAIILTLLFGPFGLLYASVTGGILMLIFLPILFVLVNVSTAFLVILFYWPACMCWSVVSTVKYNNEIVEYENLQKRLFNLPVEEKNKIIDWLQRHPGKTIDDYYRNAS